MKHLLVDVAAQRLMIMQQGRILEDFPVSTAVNGVGQSAGSGCTPCGLHRIRIKIGASCPKNTVFMGRRPTGEIYTPELAIRYPDRDWILTRILWLTGREFGKNRGQGVDSLHRFIYIHGCPDEQPLGVPRSHGCIRMANDDIIKVFDLAEKGALVDISEDLIYRS